MIYFGRTEGISWIVKKMSDDLKGVTVEFENKCKFSNFKKKNKNEFERLVILKILDY